MLPKALKSCPKSIKSPNLVTLEAGKLKTQNEKVTKLCKISLNIPLHSSASRVSLNEHFLTKNTFIKGGGTMDHYRYAIGIAMMHKHTFANEIKEKGSRLTNHFFTKVIFSTVSVCSLLENFIQFSNFATHFGTFLSR